MRKPLATRGFIRALGLALALPLIFAAGAPLSAATPDKIYEIASILQGRFEGSTPATRSSST